MAPSQLDRRGWRRLILYSSGLGLAGKIINFGTLTALAVFLSPAEFGHFSVAQLIITGAASIVSSSFGMAANTGVAHVSVVTGKMSPFEAVAYAIHSLRKHIGYTLIGLVVLVSLLYFVIMGGEFSYWVPLLGFTAISLVITDIFIGAIAGLGAVRTAGSLDAARAMVAGAAALTLGIIFGPVGAAFGLVLFDAILAIVALAVTLVTRKSSPQEDPAPNASQIATVYAGITTNGVAQIANWALLAVIQATMGLAAVGTYSVANRFATLVLLVPGFLAKNVLGELSRLREARNFPSLRRVASRYIAWILVCSAVAAVAASAIVHFAADSILPEYSGLTVLVLILSIGAAFRASATANGVVLVSLGARRDWIFSDLFATIVAIAWLSGSAIYFDSLEVLVAATVASAFTCLVLRVLSMRKRLNDIESTSPVRLDE
ncbi:lipopolysaccharide biosynthesis protein [Micrococcus terreus]|uniref:Membrane protein involved in the export of O-antigen and teichoic acid n=1 Tax=Micrococcus terreus TaxID=574650 RepID=A0A1I7ME32_9MICC|nr:hypothetical protein [Micrococcus terreus]SFV20187.1 Membrane protein involved in the export of O-antigen and teichoic acid [Micrococcus terreus]